MIDRVREYIIKNNLIDDNDSIVVGLSGGADSVCLLCILENIVGAARILAVHINHSIRETAKRDQEFSLELCRRKGIAFEAVKVDAVWYAKEHGLSTEEAGRKLRYEAFEKVAADRGLVQYKIAVAHNMDDNSETVLFNMFRGTGLKGIIGIPATRDRIIRPLLCVRRSEIEDYLKSLGQGFCTDETNLSDDYSRNRIRHHIIPVATEGINPQAVGNISLLSQEAGLIEDYLSTESERVFESCVNKENDGYMISNELAGNHHPYIQARIALDVMGIAASTRKDISRAHVDEVLGLFDKQVGKSVNLPYGLTASREYKGVFVQQDKRSKEENDKIFAKLGPGETEFLDGSFVLEQVEHIDSIPTMEYTKWIDYDRITHDLVVRTRQEGDYLTINDSGATKKLKSFFVDEKIPRDERDKILLVADGNHIVWVVGYRLSCGYKVTDSTKNILKITYKRS